MKKISLSLILAMMMVLSLLAGCGGNNGGASEPAVSNSPSTPADNGGTSTGRDGGGTNPCYNIGRPFEGRGCAGSIIAEVSPFSMERIWPG